MKALKMDSMVEISVCRGETVIVAISPPNLWALFRNTEGPRAMQCTKLASNNHSETEHWAYPTARRAPTAAGDSHTASNNRDIPLPLASRYVILPECNDPHCIVGEAANGTKYWPFGKLLGNDWVIGFMMERQDELLPTWIATPPIWIVFQQLEKST